MSKRIYVVSDTKDLTYTLVRASNQSQAVAHCVSSRYRAKAASVNDIAAAFVNNANAKIEDAGEEIGE